MPIPLAKPDRSCNRMTFACSLYADLIVATSPADVKADWRDGLRLLAKELERSSLDEWLAKSAAKTNSVGISRPLHCCSRCQPSRPPVDSATSTTNIRVS